MSVRFDGVPADRYCYAHLVHSLPRPRADGFSRDVRNYFVEIPSPRDKIRVRCMICITRDRQLFFVVFSRARLCRRRRRRVFIIDTRPWCSSCCSGRLLISRAPCRYIYIYVCVCALYAFSLIPDSYTLNESVVVNNIYIYIHIYTRPEAVFGIYRRPCIPLSNTLFYWKRKTTKFQRVVRVYSILYIYCVLSHQGYRVYIYIYDCFI